MYKFLLTTLTTSYSTFKVFSKFNSSTTVEGYFECSSTLPATWKSITSNKLGLFVLFTLVPIKKIINRRPVLILKNLSSEKYNWLIISLAFKVECEQSFFFTLKSHLIFEFLNFWVFEIFNIWNLLHSRRTIWKAYVMS